MRLHYILWIWLAPFHLIGQVGLDSDGSYILTVQGPISPDSMGITLIHEHVFLDWSPANQVDKSLWDTEEAVSIVEPYLQEMAGLGVKTFLECTPKYLGRNPDLLIRLAQSTGLQILTNTGYYAARDYDHLPPHFYELTVDEIAEMWIEEFETGIDDTGVRPGFIKIGMDSKDQLTETDKKLVRCAGLTHLKTGLTIVSHTGDDTTASQQIQILTEMGVLPNAFVWTHAQRGTSNGHIRLASQGAWISLDGMGWIAPSTESSDSSALYQYLDFLGTLKSADLLHQVLISHDAGWYTVGANDQSEFKPYRNIFTLVIPMLRARGFTEVDIVQLLTANPKRAYQVKVRKR